MSDTTKRTRMARPLKGFLIEELAPAVLELAYRGLAQRAAAAAGEIEAPLMRFGVVESQVQAFEVTSRAVGFELHQIGAAIPDFSDDGGSLVFDPGRGARQGMQEALQMRFPSADLEVEIVLPIPDGGLLGESLKG